MAYVECEYPAPAEGGKQQCTSQGSDVSDMSSGGSSSGAQQRRRALKSLKTPWQAHPTHLESTLSEEMQGFSNLVLLAPPEREARDGLIRKVQGAAQHFGRTAEVQAYGSYALQTAMFNSGLDLVVQRIGTENFNTDCFKGFCRALCEDFSIDLHEGNRMKLTALDSACPVEVNIILFDGPTPASEAVRLLQVLTEGKECVLHLSVVLRQLFEQCGLKVGRSPRGNPAGISSYTVLIMILHFLSDPSVQSLDLGAKLVTFFQYYAAFDFDTLSVTVYGAVPKRHAAPLSICDVLDPYENSAGMCNIDTLRQMKCCFTTCAISIARATVGSTAPPGALTPLSSILAHKIFWTRKKSLQKYKRAAFLRATGARQPTPSP